MRAVFGRKLVDINDLIRHYKDHNEKSKKASEYIITKEVILSFDDYNKFSQDFLEDQEWIEKTDGGTNEKGELRCIRVKSEKTGESLIVNNEGYTYARYVAFEDASESIEDKLERIASEILGIETLKERNSDSLDFHDLSVWSIKKALIRAYELGKKEK